MSATQRTDLEVQPVGDRVVEPVGGAHHGARSPITSVNVSWLCTSQRWASSRARSTRPWWASSATISCSSPPATGAIGSAMKRGISTSSTTASTSSSLQPAQPDGERRTHPPARRARRARARRARRRDGGDLGRRQPVADHLLLQEVLGEELLEAAAEVVLALGHQRGVRHREPQRVPEQRGHREPVGHRADHAGLGPGVDEAPEPALVARHDVHHRGEEQQAERHQLHPAQAGQAYGVRGGVSGHQGRCDSGLGHRARPSRREGRPTSPWKPTEVPDSRTAHTLALVSRSPRGVVVPALVLAVAVLAAGGDPRGQRDARAAAARRPVHAEVHARARPRGAGEGEAPAAARHRAPARPTGPWATARAPTSRMTLRDLFLARPVADRAGAAAGRRDPGAADRPRRRRRRQRPRDHLRQQRRRRTTAGPMACVHWTTGGPERLTLQLSTDANHNGVPDYVEHRLRDRGARAGPTRHDTMGYRLPLADGGSGGADDNPDGTHRHLPRRPPRRGASTATAPPTTPSAAARPAYCVLDNDFLGYGTAPTNALRRHGRARVLPRHPVRLRRRRGLVVHGGHRDVDRGRGLRRHQRQPAVPAPTARSATRPRRPT